MAVAAVTLFLTIDELLIKLYYARFFYHLMAVGLIEASLWVDMRGRRRPSRVWLSSIRSPIILTFWSLGVVGVEIKVKLMDGWGRDYLRATKVRLCLRKHPIHHSPPILQVRMLLLICMILRIKCRGLYPRDLTIVHSAIIIGLNSSVHSHWLRCHVFRVVSAPEPPLLVEDRAEHFIQGLSHDGKVLIT